MPNPETRLRTAHDGFTEVPVTILFLDIIVCMSIAFAIGFIVGVSL